MNDIEINEKIIEFEKLVNEILIQYLILIKDAQNYENNNLDYKKDPKFNDELTKLRILIQNERLFCCLLEEDINVVEQMLEILTKNFIDQDPVLLLTEGSLNDTIRKRMITILQDLLIAHKNKDYNTYTKEAMATNSAITSIIARSFEQKLIDESGTSEVKFKQLMQQYKYIFAFLNPKIEKGFIESKFCGTTTEAAQYFINKYQKLYELLAYKKAYDYVTLFKNHKDSSSKNTLLMIIYALQSTIEYLPADKKEEMRSSILSNLFPDEIDSTYEILFDVFSDEIDLSSESLQPKTP